MDFGENIKALLFLHASIFSKIKAMAAIEKQALFKIFNALNVFNRHSAIRVLKCFDVCCHSPKP